MNITLVFIAAVFFLSWAWDSISEKKRKKKLEVIAPSVGAIDKDKLNVLMALFTVRCFELSRMYFEIGERQKKAQDGNWVDAFVKNCLDSFTPTFMGAFGSNEENEKIDKKNNEKAKALSDNRFSYCYNEGISNIKDIKLALIKYMGLYESKRLRGIKSYGFLDNTISALIDEYEKLSSVPLEALIYSRFYHYFSLGRAYQADENIKHIWSEIILALKSSLRMLQFSKEEIGIDIEKVLKEIDALETLEWKLNLVLRNRNSKENRFNKTQEEEKIIRSAWENSPFVHVY